MKNTKNIILFASMILFLNACGGETPKDFTDSTVKDQITDSVPDPDPVPNLDSVPDQTSNPWDKYITNYDEPLKIPEGYEYVEELSDEFNGNSIDLDKWHLTKPGWSGRGSKFMPTNIVEKDGCLQLKSSVIGSDEDLKKLYQTVEENYVKDVTLRYGESLDPNTWNPMSYGDGWRADWSSNASANYNKAMELGMKTIGAAAITSKAYGGRGIYEARIKCSKIAMSSSFWLQGDHNLEYDITESYGHCSVAKNSQNKDSEYKISTSVWLNTSQLGGGLGAVEPQRTLLKTPLYSEFFVLALVWREKELIVYVNNKKLYSFPLDYRKTKKPDADGNYYNVPLSYFNCLQQVIFDTEILNGPDCGWPTKAELQDDTKNTFYVDWIRVFKEKDEDWSKAASQGNQNPPLTPIE